MPHQRQRCELFSLSFQLLHIRTQCKNVSFLLRRSMSLLLSKTIHQRNEQRNRSFPHTNTRANGWFRRTSILLQTSECDQASERYWFPCIRKQCRYGISHLSLFRWQLWLQFNRRMCDRQVRSFHRRSIPSNGCSRWTSSPPRSYAYEWVL